MLPPIDTLSSRWERNTGKRSHPDLNMIRYQHNTQPLLLSHSHIAAHSNKTFFCSCSSFSLATFRLQENATQIRFFSFLPICDQYLIFIHKKKNFHDSLNGRIQIFSNPTPVTFICGPRSATNLIFFYNATSVFKDRSHVSYLYVIKGPICAQRGQMGRVWGGD